ncbi:Tyrocidine synthase 3 [compost metagenome]
MNFSSENSSEAYNNMNDEIFDDFFNHGISNEEGTKMLSQIIHSGFSRIVVSQEEPQIRPGRRLIRHTISHNVAEQQINSNEKVTPTTKRQPHKKNMNEIKSALQSIWQDLLGVADVDVYANYFDDLGATSIHVIQANENIHKRLHREVSITEFYNHPTIHSFSLFLSDENEEDAIASQNNATNKKNANLKKRKQRMEQQLYHKEREYE